MTDLGVVGAGLRRQAAALDAQDRIRAMLFDKLSRYHGRPPSFFELHELFCQCVYVMLDWYKAYYVLQRRSWIRRNHTPPARPEAVIGLAFGELPVELVNHAVAVIMVETQHENSRDTTDIKHWILRRADDQREDEGE